MGSPTFKLQFAVGRCGLGHILVATCNECRRLRPSQMLGQAHRTRAQPLTTYTQAQDICTVPRPTKVHQPAQLCICVPPICDHPHAQTLLWHISPPDKCTLGRPINRRPTHTHTNYVSSYMFFFNRRKLTFENQPCLRFINATFPRCKLLAAAGSVRGR